MTLEQELTEAVFWGEYICLGCHERHTENWAANCCEGPVLAPAELVLSLFSEIETEREEGN